MPRANGAARTSPRPCCASPSGSTPGGAASMAATRIVILAKAPVAGSAKTRLIPLLGADGAARAAAQMLGLTVRHAADAGLGTPELCASPAPDDAAWHGHLPAGVLLSDQGSGDLGARLAA